MFEDDERAELLRSEIGSGLRNNRRGSFDVRCVPGTNSQPKLPTRPMRSSPRRSSGNWKTTTMARRPTTAPACRIRDRSCSPRYCAMT